MLNAPPATRIGRDWELITRCKMEVKRMSTETLSNKDQAHELLKERVEGKGVQAFLQLARKLDGACSVGTGRS